MDEQHSQPGPDPGNSPPEAWTGEEHHDDDLDAQLAAAVEPDALNPLDDPSQPAPAGVAEPRVEGPIMPEMTDVKSDPQDGGA